MQLHLEWTGPFPLADGADERPIYTCDLDKFLDAPGVYVFGRCFGEHFEALYVGQTKLISQRVGIHLNNVKLMIHLQDAKNGTRVILCGEFIAKGGQLEERCSRFIERALIRYFLSEGHDLGNVQGASLKQHEI